MTLPLTGRRVLVTRAAHQAGKLSDALRALGLESVQVPVLEIRPPESFTALDAALNRLTSGIPSTLNTCGDSSLKKSTVILSESPQRRVEGSAVALSTTNPAENEGCPILPQVTAATGGRVGDRESKHTDPSQPHYDCLILTSANTVRALADRAITLGISLGESVPPQVVAAVGAATATAAREVGFTVSLIPESYVAESLVASLKDQAAGKRILIARAAQARDVIPDALRAAGATVDVVDAYRNVIPEAAPGQLRQALETGLDAATFTSSSSVAHLAEVAKLAGIAFPFAGLPAISIGPITTQTLREHNWEPAAEATPSDIPGLAAAVAKILQ